MAPVEVAVGAGEPAGNKITSQLVAVPTSVQFTVAPFCPILVMFTAVGFGQVGGGPQMIVASQPSAVKLVSEVNTKVKHPLTALEVNDGGIVVPVKFPNKVPVALFPS